MAKSDDFRDLNDWKLETSLENDPPCFVHTSYGADRASGINRRAIVERWIPNPEPLGKGASGIVWLHRESSSDKNMRAVKQVSKFGMERDNIDYKKELLALIKFSGKKYSKFEVFVDFIAWFEDRYCVYFAMEYFPLGTLQGFINANMVEDDVRIISSQLIAGLRVMHEEGFAHRDLKPQNIFIVQKSPQWWIKVGDFGITKRSSNATALQTQIGTPLYRAPEISGYIEDAAGDIESSIYTNAVDIWSFACVVYEMLALHVPFSNSAKVVDFCNGGAFPEVPLKLRASDQGLDFVKRILVSHPQRRPSASEIGKDPWFWGARLETAIAALNLPNDRRSVPQFSHNGVAAGADIMYIPVSQGTLTAGVAAGADIIYIPVSQGTPTAGVAAGVAAGMVTAAANMYNGKYFNRQFSEIGGEGDNNMVLRRSQGSHSSDPRRPPSLENKVFYVSSLVDNEPEKLSWPRMEPPYIDETESSNALLGEVATRTITTAPGGADREVLDPRYRVIREGRASSEFWREGRVFQMLWSEPGGRKPQRAGTLNHSHISLKCIGDAAFTEFRQFVVIRANYGCSSCLSIHTYNGWATLKPGLPDFQNHAIIYTSPKPPAPHRFVDKNNHTLEETLTKDPIKVVREQSDREGELDPRSRINYAKLYTVEHNVRVLNIGIVDNRSMNALLSSSPIKLETQRSMGHNRRNRKASFLGP